MNHSVIFNPFTPIPKHPKSHVRGWSMAWADRLGADIADLNTDLTKYRTMYLDFGVNFGGTINLFGGFDDEVFDRCNNMLYAIERGSELVLLDSRPTNPNISEPRIGKASSSRRLTRKWAIVFDEIINRAPVISMDRILYAKSAIIGDSHTTAYADEKSVILRRNGATLNSFITDPLKFLSPYDLSNYERVTMCLGSVDIRFHLVGRDDRESPKKLAQAYCDAVKKVREHHKFTPIYVCAPVPVEYEGRRIPKSGHYKGVPFNGSREARLEYTLKFRRELYQRFDVVSPPNDWYYMDGEQYANEIMELGSSVHIAPTCYRAILKWSPHV